MKKFSADEARRKARVNSNLTSATTEADIARHAVEDDTVTEHLDLKASLARGKVRIIRPLDVAAIRAKTGLSQERFAHAFQISPHTLRNWEQGRRVPEGPARALLLAIDRAPETVMRALAA